MKKEDISQALRLTAMGRANHPLQEELAEKLEALFGTLPSPVIEQEKAAKQPPKKK